MKINVKCMSKKTENEVIKMQIIVEDLCCIYNSISKESVRVYNIF